MTSADTQTRTHSKTLLLQEKKKYTPTVVNDFFLKKGLINRAHCRWRSSTLLNLERQIFVSLPRRHPSSAAVIAHLGRPADVW